MLQYRPLSPPPNSRFLLPLPHHLHHRLPHVLPFTTTITRREKKWDEKGGGEKRPKVWIYLNVEPNWTIQLMHTMFNSGCRLGFYLTRLIRLFRHKRGICHVIRVCRLLNRQIQSQLAKWERTSLLFCISIIQSCCKKFRAVNYMATNQRLNRSIAINVIVFVIIVGGEKVTPTQQKWIIN